MINSYPMQRTDVVVPFAIALAALPYLILFVLANISETSIPNIYNKLTLLVFGISFFVVLFSMIGTLHWYHDRKAIVKNRWRKWFTGALLITAATSPFTVIWLSANFFNSTLTY